MSRPSLRWPLREAWPGAANPGQPVHLVDWPGKQVQGRALCGHQTPEVALHPTGTARRVRAAVCGPCEAAAGRRGPPPAP